ncbi:MAG: beta-ketoacyl-[Acholeplasmatales bacterium]|nr:beta-ketoacyl-[acyl-carrier-protein] synthase family protein [Acholeplasmatales bacterium]
MTDIKNRCVITGLGMINAIGNSVEECFTNAKNGVSGIEATTSVDTKDCYANLAAEVNHFDLASIKGTEGMDRVSKFAIKAATEAMEDAKLTDFNDNTRVSVIMGSCVGGAVSIAHYYENNHDADDIERMPISRIANDVASYFHIGGVVTNIANACAAGTISIAYACDLIRSNKADIVLAGGTDAFASVPYAGFLALHALDSNPCSPFNHCTGITLGEGSGVVVVESYEHALKRKAKMYCEVLGSGVSSDAHHITAPREDGEGQMNAINWAIKTSGVNKNEIGYINAHGTGTAKNDNAEFLSLHTIFDGANDDLSVSSTKAMVGHCLGAAGAIEAVFSIKCLTENIVLPTLRYSDEDLEALKEKAGKIDFIPNKAREKKLETVMSNSFAFGGNNASIIFSKNEGNVNVKTTNNEIAITGLGMVTPLGNGIDNYVEKINDFKPESTSIASHVERADYDVFGLGMTFRKHDNLSKLQVVSGMNALKDANFTVDDSTATTIGIVVGTSEGALGTCLNFQDNITEKGNCNGSAFNFPNTVYNAAGGYLSICSGIKGYNVTITNGAQSGLASIAYAMDILRKGTEEAILATGTDENIEIIDKIYRQQNMVADSVNAPYENKNGFTLSDGSISILLENKNDALKRGAKVYAKVKGYGMAHKSVGFNTIEGSSSALVAAINDALKDANISASDIDGIVGFANGDKVINAEEAKGLNAVFGDKALPIINLKDNLGESRSAGAALGVAHTALLLSGKLNETNAFVNGKKTKVSANALNKVLVVSYGFGGSYTAIVVER